MAPTKKPAPKKAAARAQKSAAKATTKPKAKRTPNAGFMKAMTPSAMLAAVVGPKPLPRTEVVKKVWDYIKETSCRMLTTNE
jgi:upstream activation factor subunit UAF30